MKSKRRIRQQATSLKPMLLFFLILGSTVMVWFVPPAHISVIILFIFMVTMISYLASTYVFSKKRQIMITSFVLLSLILSAILGFELLNTLLLLSFIIVVAKLFPNKQSKKEPDEK